MKIHYQCCLDEKLANSSLYLNGILLAQATSMPKKDDLFINAEVLEQMDEVSVRTVSVYLS